jgi:hypothetical protein
MSVFGALICDILDKQDEFAYRSKEGLEMVLARRQRDEAIRQLRESWDLMLTALEEISNAMGEPLQGCDCGECTAIRDVRAAIARAKGAE